MGTVQDLRPRIAITPWIRRVATAPDHWTALCTLDPAYPDLVRECGGLPLIVPRSDDADAVLDLVEGLILTGGDDIDPNLYGEANEGDSVNVDPEADRWELALLRGAQARQMPTLAICRGMQLMSVAFGGSLEQEIGRLGPKDHPSLGQLTLEEVYALRHDVRIEPSSRLARIAGGTEAVVNTVHHQAVADAGQLVVSARSAGGIIEGVEPRDTWPAVGVQWHPEKLRVPLTSRLFGYVVREASRYRARLETGGL